MNIAAFSTWLKSANKKVVKTKTEKWGFDFELDKPLAHQQKESVKRNNF